MAKIFFIILLLSVIVVKAGGQQVVQPDFTWGNGNYYNLNVGDSIIFNHVEVKLLKVDRHYNHIKVGNDTLWIKVSRRSLPEELSGIRIFIADNQNMKALVQNDSVHALLKKDVLLCLSDVHKPLLNPSEFVFPVSFNDGFRWTAEEDSYPLSFYKEVTDNGRARYYTYPGLGIDLHDARANLKHWLVAVENSRVVWVDIKGNTASVLLESKSQAGLYYVYSRLFSNNIVVKKGQNLVRGDVIGTAWGNQGWGHAVVSVVKPDSEPVPGASYSHAINAFPNWYELYFQKGESMSRYYTRGRITFGRPSWVNGNRRNIGVYDNYTGKGWLLGRWNTAGKVEWYTRGDEGVVTLSKKLFEGTPAQCINPSDYFEYVINVRNGTYRIRAKVGHLSLPSWQSVEFEGVSAGSKALKAGEMEWTSERAVKVTDGKLNIRIYIDTDNNQVAGLSEVVFQQAL